MERSFADAQQLHGLRYARFKGKEKVEAQCLMTAIVQNIKKIVLLDEKNPINRKSRRIFNFFMQIWEIIRHKKIGFWKLDLNMKS